MSDNIRNTIVELQAHLAKIEEEAADTKRTINSLCKAMSEPALYANTDSKSTASVGPIRRDQYYGKALATVAREILEARQDMNLGPAMVAELYDRMIEGGYRFESGTVENAKRVLRISLAKNTSVFHKLPGGAYGLLEWYPAVTSKKKSSSKSSAEDVEDEEYFDDTDLEAATVSSSGLMLTNDSEVVELPKKPK